MDNPVMKLICAASLFALLSTRASADPPLKIQFSGYEWTVKQSDSMGPGPNAWNPKNVWVDAKGQLHLKITNHAMASGNAAGCEHAAIWIRHV